MSGFDELASVLSQEVLSEMAENFFGARSRLDDLLAGFQALARQLKGVQVQVQARFAVLHHLLLRGREAAAFYRAIGVDPALAGFAAPSLENSSLEPAFGLTLQGRYAKTLLAAYEEARAEAHDYMHGRSYVDARDRGRRKLTVNYLQLLALHGQVNESVRRVNENMTPSGVMQYVKAFNPETASRERVVGAPGQGYAENLDQGMKYQPVDFQALGLVELPELPEAQAVEKRVRAFCAQVCARQGGEVRSALDALRQAASGKS